MLVLLLLLLLLLPARAEELKHYANPVFKFSLDYPAGMSMMEDREFLRKLMNMGTSELIDPKAQPDVQAMMRSVGPQFMLQDDDGSNLLCVTSPVSGGQLSTPLLTLAQQSIQGTLAIMPTAKVLLEPHEVRVGDNTMVRHDLQITMGDIPMRQAQFLVRNADTGVLYLFGVTSGLERFEKAYPTFDGILRTLKLEFPTGPRVEV